MTFVYEDGRGNAVDESGNFVLEMDIDHDNYPLDPVTDYDMYNELKPPERPQIVEPVKVTQTPDKSTVRLKKKAYSQYNDKEKEQFFFLVYEKNFTAGKAAKQLNIPRRTAYNWLDKDQNKPVDEIQPRKPTKTGGRPRILTDIHKEHLIAFVDENHRHRWRI